MKKLICALVTVLSLFINEQAIAQRTYLFNAEDRLSSSLINQIMCDHNGFIWIATEDGLNRYDGSKIEVFKHSDSDSTSISHNFINSVFEDSNGNIFVCTHGGVQIFNPYTKAFYPLPRFGNGTQHRSSISEVLELPNGEIIAVGNRHFRLEVQPDKSLIMTEIDIDGAINNTKNEIIDKDGSIWMTRDRSGVFNLRSDGSFKHYFGHPGDPVINCFALGKDNVLYAGAQGRGLYRYDRVNDRFESLGFDKQFANLPISAIYCDNNGKVYIGTDNFGMKVFDPRTGTTYDYPLPVPGQNKLKVHSITKDLDGNMWVGLFQKGALMVPNEDNNFKSIKQQATDVSLIGSSYVTSVRRDKNDNLWVGTDNDGVYMIRKGASTSRHYSEGVPSVVITIYEDSKGNIWLGAYGGQSGRLDPATGTLHPIHLLDERGLEARRVYDYIESKDGYLWVATMGGGIYKYNPATNTAEHDVAINNQINPWITSLEYSPKNDCVYLGTYNGLYRISPDNSVALMLEGIIINDIYFDQNTDILWMATADGIIKMGYKGAINKKYDSSNGLPTNTVYSIESDGKMLWLGSNCGLSCFDPTNETFTNFFVEDGIHGNEFAKKASYRAPDGTMFFGGVGGVTYFNPEQITGSGRRYDLRITDFYLGDKPVHAGMKSGDRVITNDPIYETKEFDLGPDDNSFTVEFNTTQFIHPTKVQYYYSFDGNEWERLINKNTSSSSSAANSLTFTNIASGKHKLKIKVVDNGVESDPLEINIDIAPQWYWSWWAKALYVALILSLAWLLYLNAKRRNKAKERDAERQHAEEIKETKLQFFTNISHEIRTPLSLVISPLQKLISKDKDGERQAMYHTMLRNCHRILRLVNELLDLRKIDNQQLKLKFTKTNIVSFVQDLFDTFQHAAEAKDIDMTFEHEGCDDLEVYIDRSNFDKVVVNLLSNAVKYTPQGGKVTVSISQGTDDHCIGVLRNYCQIAVTDTGIGIPKEARRHIFDRFYRFENNSQGGTGIGLHLTNQLVMLHNGTISVEDNPNDLGTAFIVRIPLGTKHINSADIVSDEQNITHVRDEEQIDMTVESAIGFVDEQKKRAPKPKSMKRVWIVEDDAEVQHYLVQNLEREFKITAYNNGAEAWENIHSDAPDLIITDAMMPEMDGMTLTRKIRQNINLNHIPILMLTAKIREEDTLDGLDAGVDDYMTKPFNIDVLIKKVSTMLENHQRLRNAFAGTQTQEEKLDDIDIASSDDKLMDRVMKVINAHMSDSDMTIEMIAEEIGISRVHLHRKLKDITSQTTRDFIRNVRLQQGAKLLREKKLSVAEVSYLVGFKHPNNFSTNFKEMFGMSPSAYSEKYYKGDSNQATPEAETNE